MRAVQISIVCLLLTKCLVTSQTIERKLGRLQEVFAWRQLSYNINGNMVLQDRFGNDEESTDDAIEDGTQFSRDKRQSDAVFFNNNKDEPDRNWAQRPPQSSTTRRPRTTVATSTVRPQDEAGRFFIQYNNVPMGVERVENRLFVTLPRRRHGIPSTLNYIDLQKDSNHHSPALRPYPSLAQSRSLVSVYRTRSDECGRLWMVDTGLLEIPNNPQQVQPPAIVVYDLQRNRQILRYEFNSSLLPAANTPTGLASITVDIVDGNCENTFAYVPDLTTFGMIVFSLRENTAWRVSHNYFSFNPTAGNLNVAGISFQWSDGIFSVTLTQPERDGCRTAYFHPLISIEEFSVSTCLLRNRTAISQSDAWSKFNVVGNRGANSQSTMHGYHAPTRVVFFADIGRNAVSCWNTATALNSKNVAVLAQDTQRLYYPSDLHVTGDEVWVMSNSLPRFGYSRLDTSQENFFIYKGNVREMIRGTPCEGYSTN